MRNRVTMIVGIVCLVALVVALILGLSVVGPGFDHPLQIVSMIVGFIAPTLAALLGLDRADKANKKTDAMRNGEMDKKIQKAVKKALDEKDKENNK